MNRIKFGPGPVVKFQGVVGPKANNRIVITYSAVVLTVAGECIPPVVEMPA